MDPLEFLAKYQNLGRAWARRAWASLGRDVAWSLEDLAAVADEALISAHRAADFSQDGRRLTRFVQAVVRSTFLDLIRAARTASRTVSVSEGCVSDATKAMGLDPGFFAEVRQAVDAALADGTPADCQVIEYWLANGTGRVDEIALSTGLTKDQVRRSITRIRRVLVRVLPSDPVYISHYQTHAIG